MCIPETEETEDDLVWDDTRQPDLDYGDETETDDTQEETTNAS